MKKIGIIGGLSWVSTSEYYTRLNQMMNNRLGGVNSAHLIIESVNRQTVVDEVIDRENEDAAKEIIQSAAKSLERGGADFIIISCNDIHRFVPDIQPFLSIPFLHIAETVALEIQKRDIKTVSLLGVRKTMEEPFYKDILAKYGIDTIIPEDAERIFIHNSIYEELVKNIFTNETRSSYIKLIQDIEKRGAQGVILGCTEIPLLVHAKDLSTPTFSTTEIHCKAAIEYALNDM